MFFDNVSTDMFFGKIDTAWNYMRQGNKVCVAARLWATQSGSWIPAWVSNFFLLKISRLGQGPTQPCIQWVQVLSQE